MSGEMRPSSVTATGPASTRPAPVRASSGMRSRLGGGANDAVAQVPPRREQRRRRDRARRAAVEPRVEHADELRVALREVRVGDAPAAREQVERELHRVQAAYRATLSKYAALSPRRLLEALDDGLALELVVDQRALEVARVAQERLRRARSRPPSRASCPSRSRSARCGRRRRAARRCRGASSRCARAGSSSTASGCVSSRWPCELLGEQRLAGRAATRPRPSRRSPAARHVCSGHSTMNVLVCSSNG